MDKGKKIGVLLGGSSSEREVSLRSGAALLSAYQRLGYTAVAIDTQSGRDLPRQLLEHGIEVAVIALHGPIGEDGTIQGLLEVMQIPYTGSGVTASAICMNKALSKRLLQAAGIATPAWEELRLAAGAALSAEQRSHLSEAWQGIPLFVKPSSAGSSVGICRVGDVAELETALQAAAHAAAPMGTEADIILEQEIVGHEITLAVLDGMTMPLIEIRPESGFFDYQNKYTPGRTRYLIPSPSLSEAERNKATATGLAAGNVLGCRGLYRVDMIMDAQGTAWVLEINTIPGQTETSLAPKAAAASGIAFEEMAQRILAGATLDSCCVHK
ncbi:D-alanine--D-alanine ligase [Candidatus Magnetaquicoccus inordinatus]|uniref:D-alanine--D-alanine ligase n=1 Tax=Candidatus Magnetaquicoccus inordinatus TaxID=2496818 RepID=UPI001D0DEE22|nr:D-alanine--D-alanine ligase [Candidatus Magnetaquicoccus inordinatus]